MTLKATAIFAFVIYSLALAVGAAYAQQFEPVVIELPADPAEVLRATFDRGLRDDLQRGLEADLARGSRDVVLLAYDRGNNKDIGLYRATDCDGVKEKALSIGAGQSHRYSAAGNVNLRRGTVAFWVRFTQPVGNVHHSIFSISPVARAGLIPSTRLGPVTVPEEERVGSGPRLADTWTAVSPRVTARTRPVQSHTGWRQYVNASIVWPAHRERSVIRPLCVLGLSGPPRAVRTAGCLNPGGRPRLGGVAAPSSCGSRERTSARAKVFALVGANLDSYRCSDAGLGFGWHRTICASRGIMRLTGHDRQRANVVVGV